MIRSLVFVALVIGLSLAYIPNSDRVTKYDESSGVCRHAQWIEIGNTTTFGIGLNDSLTYEPRWLLRCTRESVWSPPTEDNSVKPGAYGRWFVGFSQNVQTLYLSTNFSETNVPTTIHVFQSVDIDCLYNVASEDVMEIQMLCLNSSIGSPANNTNLRAFTSFEFGVSVHFYFYILVSAQASNTGTVRLSLEGKHKNVYGKYRDETVLEDKLATATTGTLVGILFSIFVFLLACWVICLLDSTILYDLKILHHPLDETTAPVTEREIAKHKSFGKPKYQLLTETDPEYRLAASRMLSEVEMERQLDAEEEEEMQEERENTMLEIGNSDDDDDDDDDNNDVVLVPSAADGNGDTDEEEDSFFIRDEFDSAKEERRKSWRKSWRKSRRRSGGIPNLPIDAEEGDVFVVNG